MHIEVENLMKTNFIKELHYPELVVSNGPGWPVNRPGPARQNPGPTRPGGTIYSGRAGSGSNFRAGPVPAIWNRWPGPARFLF